MTANQLLHDTLITAALVNELSKSSDNPKIIKKLFAKRFKECEDKEVMCVVHRLKNARYPALLVEILYKEILEN